MSPTFHLLVQNPKRNPVSLIIRTCDWLPLSLGLSLIGQFVRQLFKILPHLHIQPEGTTYMHLLTSYRPHIYYSYTVGVAKGDYYILHKLVVHLLTPCTCSVHSYT